jgi:hypothetical protein
MAALQPTQVKVIAQDGDLIRALKLRVSGVTAADTLDCAGGSVPVFSQLRKLIAATYSTGAGAQSVAAVAGSVVTVPAGPANDDGWLFITGVA